MFRVSTSAGRSLAGTFGLGAIFGVLLNALLVPGAVLAVGPASDLDPRLAGFPELTLTITESTIEAPKAVPAGRTLVIQENTTGEEAHFFILRVPDDVSDDQLAASLNANPEAEDPEWLFRSTVVGNPDRAAPDGGRVYGLVDLIPGRYMAIDPLAGDRYTGFMVEAGQATPAAAIDPSPDVVAEMFEMGFSLPERLPSGRQVWRVDNLGTAWHELALMPVPAGATTEQVLAVMEALFAGNSVPAELGPAWEGWEFHLVNGAGAMSAGRSVWTQFDLAPGTYAALCFVPTNGLPHLMAGMISIVTAGDAPAASTRQ
jgi:hypothetical protein